ncbi:MAG: CCA tRNA nucleotidyltransferase, partial [Candidatus Thermoplasmatota archaeon]|nr:CCA tRNA nucleotidyltransferase [Candidatus Thermoplasmatota archaeon]
MKPRSWRDQVLDHLAPTPQEDDRVQGLATTLLDAVQRVLREQGWEGTPRIEGSVAKGTYLTGQADLDVFVAFPPETPRKALEERVLVLGEVLDDAVVAYAEHPYVQGTWRGTDAEIVPCYDLDDPAQLRSAVDRTPFHTAWVKDRITDAQREDVRLFKAMLSACNAYGAEESVLGFSGYLAELTILRFGDLDGVLDWVLAGFPHPIAMDHEPDPDVLEGFADDLVLLDPVDPTRNVAAACSRRTLQRVREAAAAFRADRGARFFEPSPAPTLTRERAEQILEARGTRLLALGLPVPPETLEEALHAQLRRATRLLTDALERDQVPVAGAALHMSADEAGAPAQAWGLVEARDDALDRPLHHEGPPVSAGEHAERFREKWEGSEQAAGPVREQDGRWVVPRNRSVTTLAGITEPLLKEAKAGKVVDHAMEQ